MEELRNKVAESGLITIDLEKYYPAKPIKVFDIKNFLFMGQILKEKYFRESLDQNDWSSFDGLDAVITCSVDAIIPMWAYMLVVSKLEGKALSIHVGSKEDAIKNIFIQHLQAIDSAQYEGKRVVVKGCGDILIPEYAYVEISKKLLPVVKSLMYGEPCSTVPVFKRK
jgi:hypothetical protein